MKISIYGLGYVGAVSLGCLVRDGHEVIGVDIDQTKLDLIESGKPPIVEEGMTELAELVAKSGHIKVTSDANEALMGSELSFICVGTPSLAKGGQDLSAMLRLAEQLGEGLKNKSDYHVLVVRSTVVPGAVEEIITPIIEEHSGKKCGVDFDVCFQPEFLREGSSIHDYDNPPMTVVGSNSDRATQQLKVLFGHLPCEFIATDIRSAEMLKYCCNTFHALKATFANEIGRVCQSLEVDSHKVMDLVCHDRRLNISKAYMRPGFAFGGSCLPKDLRALSKIAKDRDIELPMLDNVLASNKIHIEHVLDMILAHEIREVALVGLSFKSGTDDLRESPLVTLTEQLIGKGINLRIFDPEVNLARLIGANKRYIEEAIPHISSLMVEQIEPALHHGKIVIVGLNNPAILETLNRTLTSDHLVIDLIGKPELKETGCQYQGACWT